jgi:hypothetical protein
MVEEMALESQEISEKPLEAKEQPAEENEKR